MSVSKFVPVNTYCTRQDQYCYLTNTAATLPLITAPAVSIKNETYHKYYHHHPQAVLERVDWSACE